MQSLPFAKLIALILSLVGPVPKDMPKELMLTKGQTVVTIGDSITADGGYQRITHQILTKAYPDMEFPNLVGKGIGGQKAEDLVPRFKKDVIDLKPAVVTISIGINDVWHRMGAAHDPKVLEKYKENVAKMVDEAQAAGIKVILLAPTLISEDPKADSNQRLLMYVDAERQIAADKKCVFVDLHQMFVNALANKPKDAPKDKWLTRDGVHMTLVGNSMFAVGILRGLGVPDEKIAMGEEIPKLPQTQPAP